MLVHLLGGDPKPLPLPQEHPEAARSLRLDQARGLRPCPATQQSCGAASLPSWPACCRCSCRSHPNTRSFELPFFFPFCRDFMAGAPGLWPSHLCPPRPLPYQSPMGSHTSLWAGPGLGGQGSELGVEGGLGNRPQLLPLGLRPHGSSCGRGSCQDTGKKLCLVAWPGTRPSQPWGAGSCAASQTRFLLEHLCNHRAWGGGGS